MNFYNSCVSVLQHVTPLTSVPERIMDRNDSSNMCALSPVIDIIEIKAADFADVCKLEGQAAES